MPGWVVTSVLRNRWARTGAHGTELFAKTKVIGLLLFFFFQKVLMKLRKPRITATIWSSGKIICTGATSEEEAKFGARRLARSLQKLGFQVIFTDFKVVNVLAVCNMPFEIRLPEFTKNNRPHASYEPELHPAVCYRIKSLRATLQIFSTGSITVTGPNVKAVATAVEQIYPFVFESRKEIL